MDISKQIRIFVNAGGKIFQTTKSTLLKSKYFEKVFEYHKDENYGLNEENAIFLDKDPKVFKAILSLLRDGSKFPKKYEHELEFFGIDIIEEENNPIECLNATILKEIYNQRYLIFGDHYFSNNFYEFPLECKVKENIIDFSSHCFDSIVYPLNDFSKINCIHWKYDCFHTYGPSPLKAKWSLIDIPLLEIHSGMGGRSKAIIEPKNGETIESIIFIIRIYRDKETQKKYISLKDKEIVNDTQEIITFFTKKQKSKRNFLDEYDNFNNNVNNIKN